MPPPASPAAARGARRRAHADEPLRRDPHRRRRKWPARDPLHGPRAAATAATSRRSALRASMSILGVKLLQLRVRPCTRTRHARRAPPPPARAHRRQRHRATTPCSTARPRPAMRAATLNREAGRVRPRTRSSRRSGTAACFSDHTLLFDLKTFALMRVNIAKAPETLTIDERKVPTACVRASPPVTGPATARGSTRGSGSSGSATSWIGHEVLVRLAD